MASRKRKARDTVGLPEEIQVEFTKFLQFYNSFYFKNYTYPYLTITKQYAPRKHQQIRQLMLEQMNSVQTRLFKNMFLPKSTIQYIEGPTMLVVFEGVTQEGQYKKFYLFGETHIKTNQSENHCKNIFGAEAQTKKMNVLDYFKKKLKETDDFLDIYIERQQFSNLKNYNIEINVHNWLKLMQAYLVESYAERPDDSLDWEFIDFLQYNMPEKLPYSISTDKDTTQLRRLFENLKPCLNPPERLQNKEQCELSRVHFIDIRISQTSDRILDFMQLYNALQYIVHSFEIQNSNLKILTLDQFLSFKPPTVKKFTFCIGFLFNLLNSFRIVELLDMVKDDVNSIVQLIKTVHDKSAILTKEMKKTPFKDLIFEVLGAGLYERLIVNTQAHVMWQNLKNLREKMYSIELDDEAQAEQLFETFRTYCDTLCNRTMIYLGAVAVDCYCLARVFRKFTPKEGAPPLEQPEYPSSYIIYSGSAHTRMYAKFIDTLIEKGILKLTKPFHVSYHHDSRFCVRLPPQ